jgi:putative tryptophan/tyrosine transport system substrate-binding protein
MKFLPRNQKGFSSVLIIGVVVLILVAAASSFFFLNNKAVTSSSIAKSTTKVPKKIGIIQNIARIDDLVDGYKAQMAKLGYVEGKDVVYDYQIANSDPKKLDQIAQDFLNKNDDLIMAISTTAGLAVRDEATMSAKLNIPIVYTLGQYSLQLGLIKDYKSPGVNITGVENTNEQNAAKVMEFLKQINPKISKIGIFISTPPNTTFVAKQSLKEAQSAAESQGLSVVVYQVDSPPGPPSTVVVQKMADSIKPGDVDAILQIPEPVINFSKNPQILVNLGLKLKIPTVFLSSPLVQSGGFMSYNADYGSIGGQAAVMTDKIFKGTKPTDIPIEYPLKNQLIINRETAATIGVTIPQSLQAITDQFIDKTVSPTPQAH